MVDVGRSSEFPRFSPTAFSPLVGLFRIVAELPRSMREGAHDQKKGS